MKTNRINIKGSIESYSLRDFYVNDPHLPIRYTPGGIGLKSKFSHCYIGWGCANAKRVNIIILKV